MKLVIHLCDDKPETMGQEESPVFFPIIESSMPLDFDPSAFQQMTMTNQMRLALDLLDVVNSLTNKAWASQTSRQNVELMTGPSGYVYDFSKWRKVGKSHMIQLPKGPDGEQYYGTGLAGRNGLVFYDVESSQVEAVSIYEPEIPDNGEQSVIFVRFKETVKKADREAGRVPEYGAGPYYRYDRSEPEQFQGLLEAESKGKWINTVLVDNPHHPCWKLNKETKTWEAVAIRPFKQMKFAPGEGGNE